jgi:hypothetical protein
MIRTSLFAAASITILAACASAPKPADVPQAATQTSVITPKAAAGISEFERAMQTVEGLVDAGNAPVAIQRLQQLAGTTTLTRDEKAEALFRLGEISYGPGGFDAMGAAGFFNEVITSYSDTDWYAAAVPMFETARAKVKTHEAVVNAAGSTRAQKFDALMMLGRHDEAISLMSSYNITPDNDTLIAMYQIGYLCDGLELTGRAYAMTDRDDSKKSLRFCDLGK